MPVIAVNRKDFCQLVGRDIPMQTIEERIPMLGVAWEGSESDNFEVEVFPNRPDMLSVEGLARAFSSFINIKTGIRNYKAEQSEYMVKVDEVAARPYFVSCVIKNVDFSDDFIKSIIQLQEKLMLTHGRKRKKVAIGLHDLKKINFPVLYTTEKPSFKFIPLEGEREMTMEEILKETTKGKDYSWILEGMKEYPLLIDATGKVLSMPPIINSEYTKLDTTTKDVFIDITALDEKAANEVLNILAAAFADRGGKIFKVKVKYSDNRTIYTPDLSTRIMNLEIAYVNKMLGIKLTATEVIECLKRMGFDATEIRKGTLEVVIPCYRTDIMHAFDLVEDVAIAYGYDNFEIETPNISTIGEENPLEVFSTKLRSMLIGYGLQETLTFILSNKDNLFTKMNLPEEEIAEIANSKTNEYNVVRNWLLPSMMEVLARNKHNEYPQNIFEVGDVVELDEKDDTGARTIRKLAIALCHGKANFSEMKSLVESLFKNLGIEKYDLQECEKQTFIPGRAAKIVIQGRDIAEFGEIHPLVLEKWGLEMPTAGCEINVEWLFEQYFRKSSLN